MNSWPPCRRCGRTDDVLTELRHGLCVDCAKRRIIPWDEVIRRARQRRNPQ